MKDNKIEDFKNFLCAKEIHRIERYDKIRDYIESAEKYIRLSKQTVNYKKVWQDTTELEESFPLITQHFEYIASKILYYEKLVILIDNFNEIGYNIKVAISANSDYKNIFKERIKDANRILKKLRPFILLETENYSLERKNKDLNSDIGRFYKGWYIKN